MTGRKAPDGVDPALWAEVKALTERVHELQFDNLEGEAPVVLRCMVGLNEQWALTAVQLELRRRDQAAGRNGPSRVTAAEILANHPEVARNLARAYISHLVAETLFHESRSLWRGDHHLLRPASERKPPPAGRPSGSDEPDDGVPF